MDTLKKVLKNSYKKNGKQNGDINGYKRDDSYQVEGYKYITTLKRTKH